jgi:hypothetical protein
VLDGTSTSFITEVLVLPSGSVTALLNKFHPFLGFCEVLEPGDCWLRFTDPGSVSGLFAGLGRYRILTQAELDQPVTEALCAALGRSERLNLKYWRKLAGPGRMRLGDVVFNFWD